MKGIIIKLIAGDYTIYDDISHKSIIARPRGIFRKNNLSPKVGDYVEYDFYEGTYVITKVFERKNDLIRPSICNIDQGFLVFSVKEPDLNLNLLDRFLVIFEWNDILPIIVFNKTDLLAEQEKQSIAIIIDYYKKIGYKVLETSAKNNLVEEILPLIDNKISVITGQSGVGKSSILNVLDVNLFLKTQTISNALNRGKHTTRYVELLHLHNGWIADTPGFGLIDFFDMNEQDMAHSFVEFFDFSKHCKYSCCTHTSEPNCYVKNQLANNNILKSRYENYLLFKNEIKNKKKW